MLSVLKSVTTLNTFGNTKCAEVYCQTVDHFSIICTFCELKSFDFEDFLRHFKNAHLDQSESPDQIKIKFENEAMMSAELSEDVTDFHEVQQDIKEPTTKPIETCTFERGLAPTTSPQVFPDWKEMENADNNATSSSDSDVDNDMDNESKDEDYIPKVLKTPAKNDPGVQHKCTECGNSYKLLKNLGRHINKCHNKNRVYNCPRCENTFTNERTLSAHVQSVHSGFPCDKCDKTYKSKEALNHHAFKHTGLRNFVCDVENCGKAFFSPKNLSCHKRIVHALERNYVCEMCGYRTKSKSALVVHNRSHTGEKPYVCKVCERRFASQSLLGEHKAMHLTDRPHKCQVCGATFARAKALYHHKHLHLGIKKFLCKICGKAYAQAAGLSGHMRHHKSEQF